MKKASLLAGRTAEQAELADALRSDRPELIAVYGRRRVGKTYLIRNFFADRIRLEITGAHAAGTKEQLAGFARALEARVGYPLAAPGSWADAFEMLKTYLARLPDGERHVVFFDELPWLASPRSGFLSALDHFWNTFASRQPALIVVICGSAASWMIVNVLHHKGGLHNRVTRSIALKPFKLGETARFLRGRGIVLDPIQILELFMAVGGIPYYLDKIRKGSSAAQTIDALFFAETASLQHEFDQLFAALFDHHERHLKIIEALATRRAGLTRAQLIEHSGFSGGNLSTILQELETTGFILRSIPFGRSLRESQFRLIDEFTLFHLRWVRHHPRTQHDPGWWLRQRSSPAGIAWAGYAFENACLTHVAQIKRALGIGGILTEQSAWQHRTDARDRSGAQIDLLIDRPDGIINLCEMKWSGAPFVIDKRYAAILRQRLETFRRVTGTRKSLFLTFVTAHGLAPGGHVGDLVANQVEAAALFET